MSNFLRVSNFEDNGERTLLGKNVMGKESKLARVVA